MITERHALVPVGNGCRSREYGESLGVTWSGNMNSQVRRSRTVLVNFNMPNHSEYQPLCGLLKIRGRVSSPF